MVAAGDGPLRTGRAGPGPRSGRSPSSQFPRSFEKFRRLDPSAGKCSSDIAVPTKHLALLRQHDTTDPHVMPRAIRQYRWKALRNCGSCVFRSAAGRQKPGWTGVTFDPYIADMVVRRLYITGNAAERE